jgi:DNA-binding transcriptional MerR regulator
MTFTAREVCKEVGITYRQLDYWDRTGYLIPSVRGAQGSGHVATHGRIYSAGDLERARLTKELLDLGVSWERIRLDGDPKVTLRNLRKAMK